MKAPKPKKQRKKNKKAENQQKNQEKNQVEKEEKQQEEKQDTEKPDEQKEQELEKGTASSDNIIVGKPEPEQKIETNPPHYDSPSAVGAKDKKTGGLVSTLKNFGMNFALPHKFPSFRKAEDSDSQKSERSHKITANNNNNIKSSDGQPHEKIKRMQSSINLKAELIDGSSSSSPRKGRAVRKSLTHAERRNSFTHNIAEWEAGGYVKLSRTASKKKLELPQLEKSPEFFDGAFSLADCNKSEYGINQYILLDERIKDKAVLRTKNSTEPLKTVKGKYSYKFKKPNGAEGEETAVLALRSNVVDKEGKERILFIEIKSDDGKTTLYVPCPEPVDYHDPVTQKKAKNNAITTKMEINWPIKKEEKKEDGKQENQGKTEGQQETLDFVFKSFGK